MTSSLLDNISNINYISINNDGKEDILAIFSQSSAETRDLITSLLSIIEKNGLTGKLASLIPSSTYETDYQHPDKGMVLYSVQIVVSWLFCIP